MNALIITAYIVGTILLYITIWMLYKPLKKLLVFAFNCIISCGLIWLINISLGWAGITLGINIVTATVGGLLGVPGIILMLSLGAIV